MSQTTAEQAPSAPAAPAEPDWEAALTPDDAFLRQVEAACGVAAGACYGCKKCTNGCPLTFAMDLMPYQVVRYVQLGQTDRLLGCRTVWVCASCQTCVTRCPNEVDLPRLMDFLKEITPADQVPPEEARTRLFHRLFLNDVLGRGRVFEGGLMTRYLLATGGAFGPEALANARLGWFMLKKGRMKLLPAGIKDRAWLKALKSGG